jgi:hypothetical protein
MSEGISLFMDGKSTICGWYEASYCGTRCTVCVHRQDLHAILRCSCSVKVAQSLLSHHIIEFMEMSIIASFFDIPQPLILADVVYLCIDSSELIRGSRLSLSSNHTLDIMESVEAAPGASKVVGKQDDMVESPVQS